jgi:hypothetical protein
VLTVSVERVVAAPMADVFKWLSDASNYTRSRFVLRERLVRPGEDGAYGLGAVRQLTWVFGWFRERITAYWSPHEFDYLVERSLPTLRHEGGRLTFTELPGRPAMMHGPGDLGQTCGDGRDPYVVARRQGARRLRTVSAPG